MQKLAQKLAIDKKIHNLDPIHLIIILFSNITCPRYSYFHKFMWIVDFLKISDFLVSVLFLLIFTLKCTGNFFQNHKQIFEFFPNSSHSHFRGANTGSPRYSRIRCSRICFSRIFQKFQFLGSHGQYLILTVFSENLYYFLHFLFALPQNLGTVAHNFA